MRIATRRDPVREVRKYVDDVLDRAGDTYIVGTLAAQIVERLRDEDPGLLADFLDAHATSIMAKMLGDVVRIERTRVKQQSSRRVFNEATKRFENGDTAALNSWLDLMYVVNIDEQRKRLRDMDKDDLEYAAADYTARARGNALQAAFLRALSAKVGAKNVGEVFSDDEITRMWQSVQ
jgi:hypothetical protein